MIRNDLLSTLFARASRRSSARSAAEDRQNELGVTVRYRMTLVGDIQRRHAEATVHMRSLLDACRDKNIDKAIQSMQQFAGTFRQIGLNRSMLLGPYLRWGLQRDRAATIQFESAYQDLMQSTLLIEVILSDYLGSPWDSDRQRRFVHVVVRLASLFSRGVQLETTVMLPLYLPPAQYHYVRDSPSQESANARLMRAS
ncbi:MAG: hypothetical protein OQK79_14110 [Rhodanobacter sp.]|jgi:hypothetical protein|nr:hypothetical protein [Rhodanobacter sp.]